MAGAALSDEQMAYILSHADDTRVPNIIASAAILGVFSTVFVALRLFSRREAGLRLDISDWLTVAGWFFSLAFDAGIAVTTIYGFGRHIIFSKDMRMQQIVGIVNEITYALAMALMKMGILNLYASIFPITRFHYFLWAMATFTLLWVLASVIGAIAQCIPVEYFWDKTIPGGTCWNYGTLALVITVTNIASDFIILGLPVPLVLRLQTTPQKKRLTIITLAIGSSACIISIIRLPFQLAVGTVDANWTSVPSGYLSCLELTVGIFAVSSPTYRALYRRIFQPKGSTWERPSGNTNHSWKDLLRARRSGSRAESVGSGSRRPSNERDWNAKYQHTATVYAVPGPAAAVQGNGISITDDVEMIRYSNRDGTWTQIREDEGAQG
ncbi:hypothetical protein F4861DRAFT_450797 [Xylaria intraflava]|nr:hypothetical protein F4861DRAFT_450797 [Xylaria intraflava]